MIKIKTVTVFTKKENSSDINIVCYFTTKHNKKQIERTIAKYYPNHGYFITNGDTLSD